MIQPCRSPSTRPSSPTRPTSAEVNSDNAFVVGGDGSGPSYQVGETYMTQTTFPNGNGFGIGPGQVNVPGFDQTQNGDFDIYVVKLTPDGRSLLYATVLGGSGTDRGQAIAVDASGAAYVTGDTTSAPSSFPKRRWRRLASLVSIRP